MKRTYKRELNLNRSSAGCAFCYKEFLKIDRQINKRTLNEIKIEEIKKIVRTIFESSKNDIRKN